MCQLPDFLDQIMTAKASKKHLFVWDKQGLCAQLAQYSGSIVHNFEVEQERIANGTKTVDEVLEKLRKMVIICGRRGKNLMIELGRTQPDFKT